ncbi:hypothetical protein [Hyphomonas sp.]|uniref:hypothetical protein n=1 Tax=Hyphomonas sp. TaxID=87 RepID=UPI00391C03E0
MTASTLSRVRRSILPQAGDTWASIAARELPDMDEAAATGALQSWNLHVFMRAAGAIGGVRGGNPILPSDVIFVEPPVART